MKNNALIKRGPATITLAGGTGNSSMRAEVYDGVLALAKGQPFQKGPGWRNPDRDEWMAQRLQEQGMKTPRRFMPERG